MNVRAIRKELKYSQVALAKSIGMSSTTLGRIERGEYKPTPEMICKIKQICDKHGVDFANECDSESIAAWHLHTMYGMNN